MTAPDWVSLLGLIVWPVVAVVALILLREPIVDLFHGVGGRITSVSVASVSIELAVAVDPPWTGMQGADVRHLVPADDVSDSFFNSLRQSLLSPGSADYFIVDLGGSGSREWLTSRLYLFTWILSRMKGVRAVVFLASREHVSRAYLGVASVAQLVLALEKAEPWLQLARWEAETAEMVKPLPADRLDLRQWQRPEGSPELLADQNVNCAYCSQPLPVPRNISAQPSPPLDVDGWWRAAASSVDGVFRDPLGVGQAFIRAIQWTQPTGASEPGSGWLRLPASSPDPATGAVWEHTRWLSESDLIDGTIRNVIEPDTSVINDRALSNRDRTRKIGLVESDFVALTSSSGRFEKLVDRSALLESIAGSAIRR
ncbi:hypothetical protein ACLQ2Q_15815 [Microbacterium sp. DT81.1]|uniref:hypothetical protein n=1 Tax=Microbacterium sp. DT81.1 TaxID=3393413 RepID=UPI003CF16C22